VTFSFLFDTFLFLAKSNRITNSNIQQWKITVLQTTILSEYNHAVTAPMRKTANVHGKYKYQRWKIDRYFE
jgi:hypothetical protein